MYDFGQLDSSTENDYIYKIVEERCKTIKRLQGKPNIVEAVSHVLVWSQQYIRKRKVILIVSAFNFYSQC